MADAAAILGTWKMISWTRKVVATDAVSDAMGANPVGYIAYHADGRMMALVLKRERMKPKGAAPSDEEKIALFDTMLAYSATYTLDDDKVVHHVDAAWNPTWATDLTRPYKLNGNTLVISGAPSTDPLTGEDVIYRMEFRKLSAEAGH